MGDRHGVSRWRPARLAWGLALSMALAACGTGAESQAPASGVANESQLNIPSDRLWGGDVRCRADGCWLFAVEHEASAVVLHRIEGRAVASTVRAPVGYHPDGAQWIDDRHAVAAVEETHSLDIFDTANRGLKRIAQARVPFAPRNVAVLPAQSGGWWLLALPYAGTQVAWVHWDPAHGALADPIVQTWCEDPWYVDIWRGSTVALPQPGLLVACNAAQAVGYVPLGANPSRADIERARYQVLRTFPYRSRQARLTPSQRYLYVTQDLGGRVARLDTQTGVWTDVPHPVERVSSVAPLDDQRLAWGGDGGIHLVRYGSDGAVAAHRVIPLAGFVEFLRWYDIDRNGHADLLALDLSGTASHLFFDPVWP